MTQDERLQLLLDVLGRLHLKLPLARAVGFKNQMTFFHWKAKSKIPTNEQIRSVCKWSEVELIRYCDKHKKSTTEALAIMPFGSIEKWVFEGDDQEIQKALDAIKPITPLRALRISFGLTQEQAAYLIGMKVLTVVRQENKSELPEGKFYERAQAAYSRPKPP